MLINGYRREIIKKKDWQKGWNREFGEEYNYCRDLVWTRQRF